MGVHDDDGFVSFDVQLDAREVVQTARGAEERRRPPLRRVPPTRLVDQGASRFVRATVRAIRQAREAGPDLYEGAVGYVRLDGAAGSADRRGELLEVFKSDPLTQVCLMTKASAGVGLNLTCANHALVLEPSMDAHDEVQSICRVHRIGQVTSLARVCVCVCVWCVCV